MNERNKLVSDNLGLVHACARRFVGRGIEYDDLFQAGAVGLVKAADGFDESRGLQFSTYAFPAVMGEIRRMFRDGGSVKVSRPLKELSLKAARTGERMAKQLGREPKLSELAQELGVDAEEAAQALCVARPTVSLTVSDDDGDSQMDLPVSDAEDRLCDRIDLESVISSLDERDAALIRLRYFDEKTQKQTAGLLDMSQVQVSRREKAILCRMRERLRG